MALVECKNVTKYYGDKLALNNVSLDFDEGKIFGLLGPNGAGKTTLIRIINRIIMASSGKVLFNGRLMTQNDVQKIGYLPEERGLYRKMKVGEQALFLAQLRGMSYSDARKELLQWFERFGIQSWWNVKVDELSKGMAQKIQFITTVVHRPKLMILDEPFSGFDPVNVSLIRGEMLRLKEEGATIILSTHNMESVEELCNNIALINKSNLILSGEVGEIRRHYGDNNILLTCPSNTQILPCDELFDVVSNEVNGEVINFILRLKNGVDNNRLLSYLISNNIHIISFQESNPRMNDIFIKLVKETNQDETA